MMKSQAMHALLERAHTDTTLAGALRTALARADIDAVVHLGAQHGCVVSRDDAAVFVEVATFVKAAADTELTPEELDTVAGGGSSPIPRQTYISSGL
jgi:hypothetical protein